LFFAFCFFQKSLFRRFPFRALARLAGILELASLLFSPLLELGARLGKLILPGSRGQTRSFFFAGTRGPETDQPQQSELEAPPLPHERAIDS